MRIRKNTCIKGGWKGEEWSTFRNLLRARIEYSYILYSAFFEGMKLYQFTTGRRTSDASTVPGARLDNRKRPPFSRPPTLHPLPGTIYSFLQPGFKTAYFYKKYSHSIFVCYRTKIDNWLIFFISHLMIILIRYINFIQSFNFFWWMSC